MIKKIAKKMAALAFATVFLAGSFSSCAGATPPVEKTEGLVLYTSIFPVYDFVRKIAGDRAQVNLLVPPGEEPHEWEPTTGDMVALEKADILFFSGVGMEGWMPSLTDALGKSDLAFVDLSVDITLLEATHEEHEGETEEEHERENEAKDPHYWLDPVRVQTVQKTITDTLCAKDPANSTFYQANLATQLTMLAGIEADFQAAKSTFVRRDIIVSHEAYAYLCDALELTQHGIEGVGGEGEASPAKLAELAELAREKGVTTIFFETLVNPKTAETLAQEVGIKTAVLDPFEGPKSADELSTYGYEQVMKNNLAVLKEALS